MNRYELTFLTSQRLEDNNIIINKIKNIIQEKKGIINFFLNPKRIDLAYPIEKNLVADIITIEFNFKPTEIKKFEKQLQLNKNILRYILIKKNRVVKKPYRIERKEKWIGLKKKVLDTLIDEKSKTNVVKAPQADKIKFEDIDKKLNEIL